MPHFSRSLYGSCRLRLVIPVVLGTYLFFACHDAIAKVLVLEGHHPVFVVWMRFLVHTTLSLLLLRPWKYTEKYRYKHMGLHAARSFFIVGNTVLNFAALQFLQLAETISIILSVPIIVALLSGPLLGERVTTARWISIVLGFAGVLIIIRPGSGSLGWHALLSVGSALGFALFVITTRKMIEVSTESLLLYPSAIALLLLSPAALFVDKIPIHFTDALWFFLLGAFGLLGQWCMISATKFVDASVLTPAMYTQLIWMTLFGWIVFSEMPDLWTFVGGGTIVVSGIYLWIKEDSVRQ